MTAAVILLTSLYLVADPAVRVPVTRDTWFSNVGMEADCNLGGATKLKLKSNQEMALIDIDLAPLQCLAVRKATLHLHLAGDQPLRRVTVGSFGAEWVEGTSPSYAPQAGSSSFNHRRHPDLPWAEPGSDMCSVILGQGGTRWRTADASPPDAQGWQQVAVDPAVVTARVAGLSYGFLLFDDTGSEWTRAGEKFTPHHMPNRFVHSREAGAKYAPYLTVERYAFDKEGPLPLKGLDYETKDLPAGEAWVSWVTPEDIGPAGTAGFQVSMDGQDVPRYLIPLAGAPGKQVRMRLRDLGLKPGAAVRLTVRAVDGGGNVGPAMSREIKVSEHQAPPLPGTAPKLVRAEAALPRLGQAKIAILDELDKVHPVTGELIPKQAPEYLAGNHLWNARDKQITLNAARNEFVAFQILIRGPAAAVRPELVFTGKAPPSRVSFGRYWHVTSAKGPLPDPVLPLTGPFAVPSPDENIDGQKSGSLLCELFVPPDAPAGDHTGTLILRSNQDTLELAVRLRVWNFTLPDALSFLPEMNCYGLPANERDYYWLAHLHRTVLNRVPYSQRGTVEDGCAPKWDGQKLDWTAWNRRFGPLLDGSAFADLPRKGVPLESFYLPLHENWPSPIEPNYNGDYWADRAFPAKYRQDFVTVSRQFAEHFKDKGWNQTLLQFFLNGKNNFKVNGWSRGSSPWILDEPTSFQDYWALYYFGLAFHDGVKDAALPNLLYRCDISRPQWQREMFDGLLGYDVVSSSLRKYHRMVLDRHEAFGGVLMEYGGTNAIDAANVQPVGWSIDAWALGTDGVLPWQTVGRADSWQKADTLSLFYPGRAAKEGPVPSIRLKAYRRGQQDVEYLTLLAQHMHEPRWAVGGRVREALRLAGERRGTGFTGGEDAGVNHYAQLLPQDIWALRVRVGEALSAAAPEPKKQLREFTWTWSRPLRPLADFLADGDKP